MKKFSVATHIDEDGKTQGITVEGTQMFVIPEGDLRVMGADGNTAALFSRGKWLHAFDVETSR